MTIFTKTTWVNGSAPGISSLELDRIETGIDDAIGMNITGSVEVASHSGSDVAVTVATVTLAIPAGWVSWECEAYATFAYNVDVGLSTSLSVPIRIDGTDQQALVVGLLNTAAPEYRGGAVAGRRTGMTTTGNRTIELRRSAAWSGVTVGMQDIYLYARATRTG